MNNGYKDEESVEIEDLDFDMWEGQFEFVGPLATDSIIKNFQGTNGFKKLQDVQESSDRVGV